MIDRTEKRITLVCKSCGIEKNYNKDLFDNMPDEMVSEMRCPACKGKLVKTKFNPVIIK